MFDIVGWEWAIVILSAFFIGMAKTGVSGVGTMAIPLMALVFGGKPSAGLVLPMLCFGDIISVSYYHRHAEWKYVIRILPWAVIGVFAGLYVGDLVSDKLFKEIMGMLIVGSMGIVIWRDSRKEQPKIPTQWWFAASLGLLGGFSTMIGNAAGPVMALYLLAMQLPKNAYIGTAAWFFFIINLFKIPLHVFVWRTIDWNSFLFDLLMLPGIGIGAYLGIKIVKILPEKPYRWFVIVTTLFAAIMLFFK